MYSNMEMKPQLPGLLFLFCLFLLVSMISAVATSNLIARKVMSSTWDHVIQAEIENAALVWPDSLAKTLDYVPDSACSVGPRDLAALQPDRPRHVRALYATGWTAGHGSRMKELVGLVCETELNSIVIEIKDDLGEISYVSGVSLAASIGASVRKIGDLERMLEELHGSGVYPIARLVVFKDPHLAAARPDLAICDSSGKPWRDGRGMMWTDPRKREVWQYNLAIAREAARAGFREIQFDYVRFPDDARLTMTSNGAGMEGKDRVDAIVDFLAYARQELEPYKVVVTVDVFGLVCSSRSDMGIGQILEDMAVHVDYVAPMVYPSHYRKGEYGIENPNAAPGATVRRSLSDAQARLAQVQSGARIIPWLQDFSLGHTYTAREVRAQIEAAYECDIYEFMLWNPRNVYTMGALGGPDPEDACRPKPQLGPFPEDVALLLEGPESTSRREALSFPYRLDALSLEGL